MELKDLLLAPQHQETYFPMAYNCLTTETSHSPSEIDYSGPRIKPNHCIPPSFPIDSLIPPVPQTGQSCIPQAPQSIHDFTQVVVCFYTGGLPQRSQSKGRGSSSMYTLPMMTARMTWAIASIQYNPERRQTMILTDTPQATVQNCIVHKPNMKTQDPP